MLSAPNQRPGRLDLAPLAFRPWFVGWRKTWRYSWNSQDQLIQAETPDHGVWHYAYYPMGRRIEKHRLDATGAVTDQFLFTWDGVRLAEQTGTRGDGNFIALT